jgi:hypothetical protein
VPLGTGLLLLTEDWGRFGDSAMEEGVTTLLPLLLLLLLLLLDLPV